MLFHFQLRALADVAPWGSPGKFNLHWFGLTDGWYWLQMDEDNEVFRYSSKLLAHWHALYPAETISSPYVDYYVVRLWEDILAILPDILEPLPPQLAHMLETDEQIKQWQQRAEHWEQRRERRMREDEVEYDEAEEDEVWDIYSQATLWWDHRMLNTGYVTAPPHLWFWHDGIYIHCYWDNRQLSLTDLPAWATQQGHIRLTPAQFLEEVTSFHTRLFLAMAERIEEAKLSWSRPDVALDFAALEKEQQDRFQWLARARDRAASRSTTPWNEVLDAMKTMDRLAGSVEQEQ